ncbi:hypothetical protein C8J56DRAFT_941106 [Mycena floridula]|nr:hypothetical protein C8J56DRAFT_941106 [Mycena floridula]
MRFSSIFAAVLSISVVAVTALPTQGPSSQLLRRDEIIAALIRRGGDAKPADTTGKPSTWKKVKSALKVTSQFKAKNQQPVIQEPVKPLKPAVKAMKQAMDGITYND